MALDRKSKALTGSEHLYWLHFRTLEPFIVNSLQQSEGPLLDFGCGNKPYEEYYPSPETAVGCDIVQSSLNRVDYILDPSEPLPFSDNTFSTILCTQVLEHVENPLFVLRESHRVLRPDGRFILTCPFIWELHERPHDFLRFSEYWLQKQLKEAGFELVAFQSQGGDLATIGQLISLALAVRQIHFPKIVQKLFNKFWAFLDRKSETNLMPLNYGLVGVKISRAGKEAA